MNTDKAYLLGLVIGGGIWGSDENFFRIHLPYRQWGSSKKNLMRAEKITKSIMRFVSPLFRSIYGINISYVATESGDWYILCEGNMTELKSDLLAYGIECDGELRTNAPLGQIVADLVDDFMKRRFIAGLADTIGSTNPNHRRHTEKFQTLSFELKGFNFSRVCELCRLLYSVNCIPDQVEWNHPNCQSGKNSYYNAWVKGFKIRVPLDQYAQFGSFAFDTKAESSRENLKLQQQKHNVTPCQERKISKKISCVHSAENDIRFPNIIRGGHYLHNRHFCAVLGCEHAPYDEIKKLISKIGKSLTINPFPILCKDTMQNIEKIIESNPLYADRNYSISNISVKMLCESKAELIYGETKNNGYPKSQVIQGIAFIIADENELGTTRPKGNYADLIERHLSDHPDLSVEIRKPDLLTPLLIVGNGRGALVGAHNPDVYKNLVTTAPDNDYKVIVRTITEGDLLNAK